MVRGCGRGLGGGVDGWVGVSKDSKVRNSTVLRVLIPVDSIGQLLQAIKLDIIHPSTVRHRFIPRGYVCMYVCMTCLHIFIQIFIHMFTCISSNKSTLKLMPCFIHHQPPRDLRTIQRHEPALFNLYSERGCIWPSYTAFHIHELCP